MNSLCGRITLDLMLLIEFKIRNLMPKCKFSLQFFCKKIHKSEFKLEKEKQIFYAKSRSGLTLEQIHLDEIASSSNFRILFSQDFAQIGTQSFFNSLVSYLSKDKSILELDVFAHQQLKIIFLVAQDTSALFQSLNTLGYKWNWLIVKYFKQNFVKLFDSYFQTSAHKKLKKK
ncbi:hypothetical protein BpHYR1_001493 [Brachionus plicatilis]|uniref:Uncharacterized protein n=1 Tax=Brachionus plicatilis TaxID=10195 RepID=A0A3M7QCS7_BRAPC|nr:hypothetical protein BpHYR1_001493 [Brachionus plicatilis]